MVTYDLRMCLYADRIIRMEDGRIVNTISDRAAIEDLVSVSKYAARTAEMKTAQAAAVI